MRIIRTLMMSAFLLFATVAGLYAAEQGKIGYVDLSRLFDEFHNFYDYH